MLEHMYGSAKRRESQSKYAEGNTTKGRIFRQIFLILLAVFCIPTISILQSKFRDWENHLIVYMQEYLT